MPLFKKYADSDTFSEPTFEFHISRAARDKFNFGDTFFSIKGQVIFANFSATRMFADQINKSKAAGETVNAGQINAMGLLDEIMHFLIESYRKEINNELFRKMEKYINEQIGEQALNDLLSTFADLFPVTEVYNGKQTVNQYLNGQTENMPNRHILLEELMVLWLDNQNPGYGLIKELIDEAPLREHTVYSNFFEAIDDFFDSQPPFGDEKLPLLELLQLPAKKYPNSITAQLDFIRTKWARILEPILSRILISLDFIKEEEKARFDVAAFGPGPTYVPDFFETKDYEPEQFSPDLDWMPRVVLIAKSTYVWLAQLGRQYNRIISRLDQIPDEELDRLARFGFTGLWLIGLWQRSKASQKIKQIRGNPEAISSAYSLDDYEIARELGGDEAFLNLKRRAWKRGIRLASDMVPNHMGLDSKWVINHPQRFLQTDHCPFPSYTFNGPDLSEDGRVGVFIEDGYYNQTDASVVFKRLDRHTGDVKYIYHGNDGTSMPWNDTAQLNYLLPEVREAVIQTIIHVARKFPIIRFDAAMTLAKKHYQRLWFPQPGTGGDIPTRAEYGLTKEQFDNLFPQEFWRAVVDRIQQEAPDTLLLAEAFWMMEGYFVRSLGMHRVYNSAFMNMLKNEENAKYRQSIKNVLEFNPQILKRYVNFMNNPDEDTAIAQFGKDDKYFGVCIMMSTMPGLPMFGHGQIEGFTEKYGMEYSRDYWDEKPDQWLIDRHIREIFPLLRHRYLFSDVENFLLYDFYNADGSVNENVFAYSNRFGDERALVLYHNKFAHAAGWIRTSAAYPENEQLRQKSLAEGLNISNNDDRYICFREAGSGLEFIRSCKDIYEQGLYVELGAYKYQIFVNFHDVQRSDAKPYELLAGELNGRGVPSIEDALNEYLYRDILHAFYEAVNPGSLRYLADIPQAKAEQSARVKTFNEKMTMLCDTVSRFEKIDPVNLNKENSAPYESFLQLVNIDGLNAKIVTKKLKPLQAFISEQFGGRESTDVRRLALVRLFLKGLADIYKSMVRYQYNADFIRDRYFSNIIKRSFKELEIEAGRAENEVLLLEALTVFKDGLLLNKKNPPQPFFEQLESNQLVRQFIQLNRYNNIVYVNKEQFERLLFWLLINRFFAILSENDKINRKVLNLMNDAWQIYRDCIKMAEENGYRWEDFVKESETLTEA